MTRVIQSRRKKIKHLVEPVQVQLLYSPGSGTDKNLQMQVGVTCTWKFHGEIFAKIFHGPLLTMKNVFRLTGFIKRDNFLFFIFFLLYGVLNVSKSN